MHSKICLLEFAHQHPVMDEDGGASVPSSSTAIMAFCITCRHPDTFLHLKCLFCTGRYKRLIIICNNDDMNKLGGRALFVPRGENYFEFLYQMTLYNIIVTNNSESFVLPGTNKHSLKKYLGACR